jgi:uncharacterized protein (TIGR02300 family)
MAWAAPLVAPDCAGRLVYSEGPIIVMAKPELGMKRTCVACSTRFYDLTKSPAVCPKCGTEQPIDQPRPRRTGGNVVEDKRPKKAPVAPEDVDVEVEVEEAEDEDVLEATDDLEDDADAISADIEVETDSDENER